MIVGFVATVDVRTADFQLIGSQAGTELLKFQSVDQLSVVFQGRLHYRRELGARNCIDDLQKKDDSELVLAVYRRAGLIGLESLEGVYSFTLVDFREGIAIGQRDPMGGFPLFWMVSRGKWHCGSSLSVLRTQLSDEFDEEYLAEYLSLPAFGYHEPQTQHTVARGIRRVLPGHQVTCQTDGLLIASRRYWNWLEQADKLRDHDFHDTSQEYGARLNSAVTESVCGTTASHLSGGMDSTSVCLLALRANRLKGGNAPPLHSISLVYNRMRVLSRERELIQKLAGANGDLQSHLIEADDHVDFDMYANPPWHDEPWPWLSAAGIESLRIEKAASIGARTVLTGQGADEMADMGPYHITDLLRNYHWHRAWTEASRAARAENCSVWSILFPFGVQNLVPLRIRDGLRPFLRGGYTEWNEMREATIPPWISPEFSKRHSLWDRMLHHERELFYGIRPTVLAIALAKIQSRAGDLGRWYLAAPHGILNCHPFLDSRVLLYCLGIHSRFEPPARGRSKPLLADAMRDILPVEIRMRPKSGFFNEPYFRGLSQYRFALECLIRASRQQEHGFFDPERLVSCLQQNTLGVGGARIQLDRINLTLSFLKWSECCSDLSKLVISDERRFTVTACSGDLMR